MRGSIFGRDIDPDSVWQTQWKTTVFWVLPLTSGGHPADLGSYIAVSEDAAGEAKRRIVKDGFFHAVIPIELQFPDLPLTIDVHRLAGFANAEVEQATFSVYQPPAEPGRARSRKSGPTLKQVRECWAGLSDDAREAIQEILWHDEGRPGCPFERTAIQVKQKVMA
ncbi:hypothetical protein [Crateriforma spongiae]|uniref:hypothetical protein n=1 Tax=Crateriforma spongiae TaxID=2724528 RepID=UPI0014466DFE|nr:hypothetical protein [Crateriforma spongiae]